MTKPTPHYYPFGSLIPNRSWSDASRVYRYGFNGKEKDFETSSDNYDFGARIYDGRLGRWLSVDILLEKYPSISPFTFCGNIPTRLVDPDGKKIVLPKGTSTHDLYLILGTLQKMTNDKLVFSTQKDGSIRIKVASLGKNIDKPSGTNLIRELNSNKNTITIKYNPSGFSNEAPSNGMNDQNQYNGVGTNSTVTIGGATQIYNVEGENGENYYRRGTYLTELGHELVHALATMNGEAIRPEETTTNKYEYPSGNTNTETYPKEELYTVGVVGERKYTENTIREEQGLEKRVSYDNYHNAPASEKASGYKDK